MDALKAEIASKRKALQDDSSERPTKYMRRGELERLKEEQERKEREEAEAKERAAREEAEVKAVAAKAAKVSNVARILQGLGPDLLMENRLVPGRPIHLIPVH